MDKRWLHTLLTMVNVPAAAALSATSVDDDNTDCDETTAVHQLSLPKRVIIY